MKDDNVVGSCGEWDPCLSNTVTWQSCTTAINFLWVAEARSVLEYFVYWVYQYNTFVTSDHVANLDHCL